jgi:hypothetical protein
LCAGSICFQNLCGYEAWLILAGVGHCAWLGGANARFKLRADIYGHVLVFSIPLFYVIRSQI